MSHVKNNSENICSKLRNAYERNMWSFRYIMGAMIIIPLVVIIFMGTQCSTIDYSIDTCRRIVWIMFGVEIFFIVFLLFFWIIIC